MAVEEKLAKRVQKYFGKLQKEASNAVLLGDKKASDKASLTFIRLLTAENNALSALGWEWAREENGDICEPPYIVPLLLL